MKTDLDSNKFAVTRRKLLSAAPAGGVFAAVFQTMERSAAAAPDQTHVNRHSSPSDLRITDLRAATIAAEFDYPVIRIDTNQGISGLGEVAAGGAAGCALALKAHLVGRNPLRIGEILDSIRLSAGQQLWNTGYGAIDLALHDIAGKACGVPLWRLLGGQVREQALLYCEAGPCRSPRALHEQIFRRRKMGFRFFQISLPFPAGALKHQRAAIDRAIGSMCESAAAARDALGPDTPLCVYHSGPPLDLSTAILCANALDQYNLAWAGGWIGQCWLNWQGFKTIRERTRVPLSAGKQGFGLEECFRNLIHNYAVDIVHPNYVGSGGIREIKRIADFAAAHGTPVAIHMPGSPIGQAAMAHLAAVLPNFLAMSHPGALTPGWEELVSGRLAPWMHDGYMEIPHRPGLGVELNEEAVRARLRHPGYFEPTPQYDRYISAGVRRGSGTLGEQYA